MNIRDINKKIRAMQVETQKKIGLPLPTKWWQALDEDLGNIPEDYDGDPAGAKDYLESYQSVAEKYTDMSRILLEIAELKNTEKYLSGRKEPKVKGEKRYQRSFVKQSYLLKFVLDSQPAFPPKRIDWKCACAEWNKVHPNDIYTKEVLKVNYYRALAREDIRRIYHEISEARLIEKFIELCGDASKAKPAITSLKMARQYINEVEDIDDEVEADVKQIQSMILLNHAFDIIQRQKELRYPSGGYNNVESERAQLLALGEILVRYFPELVTIREGDNNEQKFERINQAIDTVIKQGTERFEEFVKELLSKGEGEYTETLIKALYDIDDIYFNFIKVEIMGKGGTP